MALLTGADNGTAGTSHPATLFQASNTVSRYFCTMAAKDTLAPVNKAAIKAFVNGSAAAARGDTAGMLAAYEDCEKGEVARFLQYSLREAADASKRVTKKQAAAATACYSPCLLEAKQVRVRAGAGALISGRRCGLAMLRPLGKCLLGVRDRLRQAAICLAASLLMQASKSRCTPDP